MHADVAPPADRPIASTKPFPFRNNGLSFLYVNFVGFVVAAYLNWSAKSHSSTQRHCFVKCSNDLLADVYKDTNEFCSFLSKSNCFA